MTNKKVCDENRSVFLGVRGPFPGFSPSSLLPAVWRGVPPFTGAQNAVMSSVLWKPESQKMPLALSLFPSLPPSLLRKLLQLLSRLPPRRRVPASPAPLLAGTAVCGHQPSAPARESRGVPLSSPTDAHLRAPLCDLCSVKGWGTGRDSDMCASVFCVETTRQTHVFHQV